MITLDPRVCPQRNIADDVFVSRLGIGGRAAALDGQADAVQQLVANTTFVSDSRAGSVLSAAFQVALKRPDGPQSAAVLDIIRRLHDSPRLQRDLLQVVLQARNEWRQRPDVQDLTNEIVQAADRVLTEDASSALSCRVVFIQVVPRNDVFCRLMKQSEDYTWNTHGVLVKQSCRVVLCRVEK